jgi:hypothetical protein
MVRAACGLEDDADHEEDEDGGRARHGEIVVRLALERPCLHLYDEEGDAEEVGVHELHDRARRLVDREETDEEEAP